LNKAELVDQLAGKTSMTKSATEKFVNAFVDCVEEALSAGNKVQLVGFGTFEVRERQARKGRNPKTGAVIDIPATRVPAFKAGKDFKNMVNVKPLV